ncbi:MAG: phytoene/squalene synthase family protein [Solirubrobacterales bacterium]
MGVGVPPVEAYRHCETITRKQAANFYYGIRLLPHDRRRAMCAVYAFARRVDDIGDGSLERAEKLRRLDAEALALADLSSGAQAVPRDGYDPVIVALADARERFSLPPAALGDLIEGVRMDVGGVTYERFEDLVLYCRRVAGAIGRVCLAIFGAPEQDSAASSDAEALADDLGVALQLTNILRDLREDAENGRVYLPAEDLRRFGLIDAGEERAAHVVLASLARSSPTDRSVPDTGGATVGREEQARRLAALVRFEAERAQQWFDRGIELAPLLDRRSAACVLAMAGIYHKLLGRIEAHPERVLHERMSLPAWEKAWVAAGSMLATDLRARRRMSSSAGKAIGGRR